MPAIEFSERSEMIHFITMAGVALTLSVSSSASGNEPRIPVELHRLVAESVDLTLKQEYASADSVVHIMTMRFPGHPFGYLYSAAVMEAKSMDYLDPLDYTRFDSVLNVARNGAEKTIRDFPQSPLGYYYLGTAIGYDAYAQVDAGNWLGGILKGLSAASEFRKCIEIDSSFYDAYVGVGTYYYWKSRKIQFLNWMLGDNRDEGIRMLQLAVERAEYNKFAALSVLAAVYLDRKEFDRAVRYAEAALDMYPNNRIFLGELAEIQEQSGDLAGAVGTYGRLLASIIQARINNPYSEIYCRMHLLKAKLALKETNGIDAQIDAILAYEHYAFPKNLVDRANDKFREARDIKAHLSLRSNGGD